MEVASWHRFGAVTCAKCGAFYWYHVTFCIKCLEREERKHDRMAKDDARRNGRLF